MSGEVVVVGAGLAGLCCAVELRERGIDVLVLEAADAVGGRVRTDEVGGFRLDRGFQVLLPAYPEARRRLDYEALELRPYAPGAVVRREGRFVRVMDPFQRPGDALPTLRSGVASLADALRVLALRRRVCRGSLDALARRPERSTFEALVGAGFSERIIESFFRPFFGGVFLDGELATSSRFFDFAFRFFAEAGAAVPASGMEAIPRQLASRLPQQALRCQARVEALDARTARLESGERISCRALVVATDAAATAQLVPSLELPAWNATTCLSFSAPEPPLEGPYLVLNGEGRGPVNNLAVPSEVSPRYAPAGRALVSVTVLGDPKAEDDRLEAQVREQLGEWFGASVADWRLLRLERIRRALPSFLPHAKPAPLDLGGEVFVCGDHQGVPSIQTAMEAGRRAGEAVAQRLGA